MKHVSLTFNTCSVFAIHSKWVSVPFGIYPEEEELYRYTRDGHKYKAEVKRWLWGYAVEPYDHCLAYYGFGPFLKIVVPN